MPETIPLPRLTRFPARRVLAKALAGAALVLATGCGGGQGAPFNGSMGNDPVPAALPSPPVDPSYYNVPSTTLGASLDATSLTFSYWNPSALTVSANLYNNWDDPLDRPAGTVGLGKDGNGVWTSAPVAIPLSPFYVFKVNGTYVLDPYAKAMGQWLGGATGAIAGDGVGKGAILDPADTGPDGSWFTPGGSASPFFDGSAMKDPTGAGNAPYRYQSNRDAIIYEAGIRDFTVDPSLSGFAAGHRWGTYKGMVDLLPHIQKLGVTHVQLLCPLANHDYDQTRIGQREWSLGQTAGANHSWGYDPHNFFSPTGMYSANPDNPAARINELKTLINEIHRQGMGVILDVVYNHTATNQILADAGLQDSYYRASTSNGSGSRDLKTESKMTRKLIIDSIRHWVGEYHVDGFRFDLMGVLDTQTVAAAYAAARDLNPRAIFLGEGRSGLYAGSASDFNGNPTAGADPAHAAAFTGKDISLFSDGFRQILKGAGASDGAPAFLTNQPQDAAVLFNHVAGRPADFSPGSSNGVVNALTGHDNLCLYDALALATGATAAEDPVILQRAKLGYAVLLTSQGAAFIHGGDELFRTKETTATPGTRDTRSAAGRTFVAHSDRASDAINRVDWLKAYASNPISAGFRNYATGQPGYQLYAYAQGLIAIRKASNAFRLPDNAPAANFTALPVPGTAAGSLALAYRAVATDGSGTYHVFHNAARTPQTFTVATPLSGARLLADGVSAGLAGIPASSTVTLDASGLQVTLAPLCSAIFRN